MPLHILVNRDFAHFCTPRSCTSICLFRSSQCWPQPILPVECSRSIRWQNYHQSSSHRSPTSYFRTSAQAINVWQNTVITVSLHKWLFHCLFNFNATTCLSCSTPAEFICCVGKTEGNQEELWRKGAGEDHSEYAYWWNERHQCEHFDRNFHFQSGPITARPKLMYLPSGHGTIVMAALFASQKKDLR